jgi:nitroreductase
MEYREVLRRRRMVRDYTDEPLDPEVVERILASALRAPSAGFSQGWEFLALTEPQDRERFWPFVPTSLAPAPGLSRARLVVVPMADKQVYLDRYAEPDKPWQDLDESHWPIPYWHIDTGMASLLMLLTAVDEGLAACFFGIQAEQHPTFHQAFGVPDDYTAIGCITVGYAGSDDRRSPSLKRGRRSVEEVVHRGRW